MWSREGIELAARQWRAVANGYKESPELFEASEYQLGLSEGYASALEMVLREEK